MADCVNQRVSGSNRHSAKVMSEGKDWPIMTDGTEVSVLSVRKNAVVDELSSNNSVLASLVGHRGRLLKKLGKVRALGHTCVHSE